MPIQALQQVTINGTYSSLWIPLLRVRRKSDGAGMVHIELQRYRETEDGRCEPEPSTMRRRLIRSIPSGDPAIDDFATGLASLAGQFVGNSDVLDMTVSSTIESNGAMRTRLEISTGRSLTIHRDLYAASSQDASLAEMIQDAYGLIAALNAAKGLV